MKNNILYIWIVVLCLLGSGCGHYLEEYSKNLTYASSCEDLNEVLVKNGYLENTGNNVLAWVSLGYMFVLDDDTEELLTAKPSEKINGTPAAYWRNVYTWQRSPFHQSFTTDDQEFDDVTLKVIYQHIAYVNTIIDYVKEFPNDPIEMQRKVLGEAQFLRAAYYLLASNLYGWAYDVKNEGKDLSVPLKTYPWVVEEKFSRSTVGEVYSVIENDLKGACENLRGIKQKNFYRTNQLAARTLLSRVCLYMEKYDEAIMQCDSALAMGCPLSDLSTYYTTDDYSQVKQRDFLYNDGTEVVFTMGNAIVQKWFGYGNQWMPTKGSYVASEDLLEEFKVNDQVEDLRRDCYFMRHKTARSYYMVCKQAEFEVLNTDPAVFETFLIRTAEVYLNKAEAQAMKGDLAGAVSTLQPLLQTRYAAGKLPQLTSLDEEELVEFIRAERRRELCFEGHRWADLKRYAVNSRYPLAKKIVHRVFELKDNTGGSEVGVYVLKPYGEDNGWIMPFQEEEMLFNDGKLENVERPERLMGEE